MIEAAQFENSSVSHTINSQSSTTGITHDGSVAIYTFDHHGNANKELRYMFPAETFHCWTGTDELKELHCTIRSCHLLFSCSHLAETSSRYLLQALTTALLEFSAKLQTALWALFTIRSSWSDNDFAVQALKSWHAPIHICVPIVWFGACVGRSSEFRHASSWFIRNNRLSLFYFLAFWQKIVNMDFRKW